MKYRLVVFDCDGTLVDTAVDVAHCFNEALKLCGFAPCSFEMVSSLIGKPLEAIVEGLLEDGVRRTGRAYAEGDVAEVAASYRSVYADYYKPNTRPFPGMDSLVDDLLDAGVAVAVNSNKPESALVSLIGRCFPGRDMHVTGYVADRPTKPDPTGALRAAARAGVSAEESVYVGDTQVDLDTAINAGMECVIMTWGQGNGDLYARAELAACCDSAGQLKAALFGGTS